MNREDLIQVNGPAEAPPETMTTLATDDDGNLYHVHYSIDAIEPTDDSE